MNTIMTPEEAEFIREFYPKYGRVFCSRKLNRPKEEITAYAGNYNIRSNNPKSNNPKYECNIDEYFDIYSPEIIYMLGFLWADGSMGKTSKNSYQIRLTITEKDAQYIDPLLEKWQPLKWGKLYKGATTPIILGKKCNGKPTWSFSLTDKYFARFLIENDYLRKSGASADKILSIIPEHLKSYWWRGYFDGDGSFYFVKNDATQIEITSTVHQDWFFAEKLCQQLDIHYSIQRNSIGSGGQSRFRIRRINDCIKFMNYIYGSYEKDQIGYRRKYNRFKEANLKPVKHSSEHLGVSYDKCAKRWKATYKGKYIGGASTEEEAFQKRQTYLTANNLT